MRAGIKTWRDIHDIDTWPPGALMVYDNIPGVTGVFSDGLAHSGIGLVVANDKLGVIWVLWGDNCNDVWAQYSVRHLNPLVIKRVG